MQLELRELVELHGLCRVDVNVLLARQFQQLFYRCILLFSLSAMMYCFGQMEISYLTEFLMCRL